MVTVPGWNPDDKTGKATAAFESQARVPSWYDTGRWQMNPGSPLYQQFAQEQVKKILALQPAGTGVFFDNVADYPHAAAWMGSGVVEFGGASADQAAARLGLYRRNGAISRRGQDGSSSRREAHYQRLRRPVQRPGREPECQKLAADPASPGTSTEPGLKCRSATSRASR